MFGCGFNKVINFIGTFNAVLYDHLHTFVVYFEGFFEFDIITGSVENFGEVFYAG